MAADVRAVANLAPVPFVPEISLYQAPESTGLWDLCGGEYSSDRPPPFWAFAWPGGQALARYLLDHPGVVSGRRVLDVATGSGVAAVAAALSGAAAVRAVDTDPDAATAVALNAEANGVRVAATVGDPLDGDAGDAEVVLGGDVFYSGAMAGRVLDFLRRSRRAGARVLVGDPDRDFLVRRFFAERARYQVPVRPALEDTTLRFTTVWEMTARQPSLTSGG